MIVYHVILRAVIDKNEHIVQTRGRNTSEWGQKGMKRVSSDAKIGKKARNMIFFTSCEGLSF